jgi:hypothetical protein
VSLPNALRHQNASDSAFPLWRGIKRAGLGPNDVLRFSYSIQASALSTHLHVVQALPHALHALGQAMNPQHGMDPYIPMMPSLSLDSFFASYDEQSAAAQRAQAPPSLVENVLPAWEDVGNGQSGSLQGGGDWRVRPELSSISPFHKAALASNCLWCFFDHGASLVGECHGMWLLERLLTSKMCPCFQRLAIW